MWEGKETTRFAGPTFFRFKISQLHIKEVKRGIKDVLAPMSIFHFRTEMLNIIIFYFLRMVD